MEPQITMLLNPLPGIRVVDGQEDEDGSIVAFRKGGDEALFASWDVDTAKGMKWIPIEEFSVDPEAVKPADLDEGQPGTEEQPAEGETPVEVPSKKGPFGNIRRRKELEE